MSAHTAKAAVLYGVVRLVPEQELSKPLIDILMDSFHQSSDASPPVLQGPTTFVAGSSCLVGDSFLASRRPPLFWSHSRHKFVTPESDVIGQVLTGELVMASDECLLMHDARTERTHLLSSCAGATLLYFSQLHDCILFATSIARFKCSRAAPIDVIGVAEIVRFGATYGRRTLVSGIEQLPFAHRLEVSAPRRLTIQPYADYAYAPKERMTEPHARSEIARALRENLGAGTEAKHLMFSGGVDSSLLASIGGRDNLGGAWFLSMTDADPEEEPARQLARQFHLDLNVVRLQLSLDGMVDTVRSYTTPTVDFAMLPTYFLGQRMALSGVSAIVDGTGADSWFGFRNLEYAKTWARLTRLPGIAKETARALYARLISHDTNPLVRPLKVLSRLPRRRHAGLGNLCGSPLYARLVTVRDREWLDVEDSVIQLWSDLVGKQPQDEVAQVLTIEATLSAINAAAAKSSQWNLSRSVQTVYPFLMPGTVAVARSLSRDQLTGKKHTKPMLRDLLIERGVPAAVVNRTKAGFLPPLFGLLNNRERRGDVLAWLGEPSELDEIFTPYARTLPRRLLSLGRELTFHAQNPLWVMLALKAWVSGLRQNRLAVI